MLALKGYFAISDVQLVERNEEDVSAFHDKERNRWLVVYEEEPPPGTPGVPGGVPLEFYPGDRVKVVGDVKVKETSAQGMLGTVTHYEFDDGYECCQTLSTSTPVDVLLDEIQS